MGSIKCTMCQDRDDLGLALRSSGQFLDEILNPSRPHMYLHRQVILGNLGILAIDHGGVYFSCMYVCPDNVAHRKNDSLTLAFGRLVPSGTRLNHFYCSDHHHRQIEFNREKITVPATIKRLLRAAKQ